MEIDKKIFSFTRGHIILISPESQSTEHIKNHLSDMRKIVDSKLKVTL